MVRPRDQTEKVEALTLLHTFAQARLLVVVFDGIVVFVHSSLDHLVLKTDCA